MKSELGDKQRLQHISQACTNILKSTDGFNEESFFDHFIVNAAVCYFITIIGEATANLSKEFKERHIEFNWKAIKGMRNIIVHKYFGVDYARVWFTVQNHIPKLKTDCENAIK